MVVKFRTPGGSELHGPPYTKAEDGRREPKSPTLARSSETDTNGLLKWMRRHNVLITRENYLNLAYMGKPPARLTLEEEEGLPPEVRKLHR